MPLTKDQFAEQLKHHRALCGLNQIDVARAVKVELRTYQRWEAGERMPYKRHILALANALDVDVQVFTGELSTSEALHRIEQAIAENNRLLRQLLVNVARLSDTRGESDAR
jgi:transcriptional regulator with XRE-family HTH domain